MAAADFRVKNGLIVNENLQVFGNSTLGESNTDTTTIWGLTTIKDGNLVVKNSADATVFSFDRTTGNLTISGLLASTGTSTLANLTLSGALQVDGNATIGNGSGDVHTVTGTVNTTGQMNVDNLRLDGNVLSSTDTNGNVVITPNGTGIVSVSSAMTVGSNLTVTGNLTINGTTTTVNSTTTTLDDPILTLGGDTAPVADDNKDRGIEFRYFDTAARLGFFGYDDSTGKFTFLTGATNSSEVFSGTKGELDASVAFANILNKPSPVITLGGDLTGSVTLTELASGTLTATIAANSVALGTDTTGDYAASVAVSGNGLTLTGTAGEGTAFTVNSNAVSANTASTLVFRDASGNFSAGTITAALTGTASDAAQATKWTTARTITLGGDLTGSVSINGTADVTLTATVAANSVALGTDTTGNYIATIAGTANQVIVSGSGSETSAVTLSLPQDIATTSTPTFTGTVLSTTGIDANTRAEFNSTTGMILRSVTDVLVALDNDNNSANSKFFIQNGADATVFTVEEDGSTIIAGSLEVTGTTTITGSGGATIATNATANTTTYSGNGTITTAGSAATLLLSSTGSNGIVKLSNANGDVTLNANGTVTFTDGIILPSMNLNTYTVTGVTNDISATAPSDKLATANASKSYTDQAVIAYAIVFGL
jgi:hypothetical protein